MPWYIFPIIVSFAGVAKGQSDSSCLFQARWKTVHSFSVQQQKCIEDYVTDVRSRIPQYNLSERRFGGSSQGFPADAKAPILGAGFGSSSFVRQLGLKVHGFSPVEFMNKSLLRADELLNCNERRKLNDVNFLQILLSVSTKMSGSDGLDMLETPMGELFLDFFAASPSSKVVLTLRDPMQWATEQLGHDGSSTVPFQLPCGGGVQSPNVEVLAKLMESHNNLVRCMVPPEQLLEVSIDANPDTEMMARFFGHEVNVQVPMPQSSDHPKSTKFSDRWASSFDEPAPAGFRIGDRLPICITGQIGRLELRTKIQRLIQPALDVGHKVEVYLVLDPRPETTFIHRPPGTDVGNYTIVGGNFTSLNETVNLFPLDVPVILDPFIPQDYSTDERYASLLMKSNEAHNPIIEQVGPLQWAKKRAKSHMRQWEMFARCWELFQMKDRTPPKAAMRIRDDLVFVAPFVPELETLRAGLYVDSCEGCGGLNDKLALLSGTGVVTSYFTEPLRLMREDFNKVLSQNHPVANPESVLYNVMQVAQVQHYSLDIPCYRATWMRDAQSSVHLCYFYTQGSGSCFKKIWPILKVRTSPVFASNAHVEGSRPTEVKDTKGSIPAPATFLQTRSVQRVRRWGRQRHWGEEAVERRRDRFKAAWKKMVETNAAQRENPPLRRQEPAYVCEN